MVGGRPTATVTTWGFRSFADAPANVADDEFVAAGLIKQVR
jgi:hypothetical protein